MFAEVNKRVYDLCIDLLGPTGQIGYDYTMRRAEALGLVGPRVGPQDVHPVTGQLDRGWHLGDPAQHPRRADPRACPATSGSTRSCPGRRCLAVDRARPVVVAANLADGASATRLASAVPITRS
jgi:hypothetical protein